MKSRIKSNPLPSSRVVDKESNNITAPIISESNYEYLFKIYVFSANKLVYLLTGASVFVVLWFALSLGPISPFQLHIIFSVVGYQVLISIGILDLNPFNGWAVHLTRLHRRRAHWILQLVGSLLAIAGSVIMMREKHVNFNSTHGMLALGAFVTTCISLINGTMTLYNAGIGHVISPKIFKNNHMLLGTVAFTLSSACLAFGVNKNIFREWASDQVAYLIIGNICIYTVIVIAQPCSKLWMRYKTKTS